MSLLRLLTTGKTLVGLKKLEQRYRLPDEQALPQFGSKKNPFRATVFPEKPEATEPEICQAAPAMPAVEAAREPVSVLSREQGQNQTPGVSQPKPPSIENIKTTAEAPARRSSGFRAFLLWGRAKKNKPAALASGRPLIQAELSLDTVRVVRNDLSETDLEVVAATPAAQPIAKRVEPEPGLGVPEITNVPAAGRLVEAGKM